MIKVFEIKIRNSEIDSCNKKKKKNSIKFNIESLNLKYF